MMIRSVVVDDIPEEVFDRWKQYMYPRPSLEAIARVGIPVVRYSRTFGGESYWIPMWGHRLLEGWRALTGRHALDDALQDLEGYLQRVALFVRSTGQEDFVEAALSCLQLGGFDAVATLLRENRDLARR